MNSENWKLTWSEWCYSAMLSLYPVRFRVRFKKEMTQVFRDSCRDEVETLRFGAIAVFWFRTLKDLAESIPRERGRAFLEAPNLQTRAGSLIESVVILSIIGSHLLMFGTLFAMYIGHRYESAIGFLFVAVGSGAALGGLGVLCSVIMARFRQIHYRYIEL